MLKSCPHFLRGRLREGFGFALRERLRAKHEGDVVGESRAWKLFVLLLMMLLYQEEGGDELARTVDTFTQSKWTQLINEAAQHELTSVSKGPNERDEERRGSVAQSLIQKSQVPRV